MKKFEQSELTKLIEESIIRAIKSIQSGKTAPTMEDLQLAGSLHGLLEKIHADNLDVRFVSRDE